MAEPQTEYDKGFASGLKIARLQILDLLDAELDACDRHPPFSDETATQCYEAALNYIRWQVRRKLAVRDEGKSG